MDAIETLRQSVKSASDLEEPWNLFHDELAMSAEFMTMGAPKASGVLLDVIAKAASNVLGEPGTAVRVASIHLKKQRMWHGCCSLAGRPIVWFYFEDLEIGLAGILSSLTGGKVDLIRFTCVKLRGPAWRGGRARAKA